MAGKISFAITLISLLILLYAAIPSSAWFLDTPTNPPTESSYPGGNTDYENARPANSWQPSGPSLNPGYDPFARPPVDHHAPSHSLDHGSDSNANPNSNPGYPGFGYRHSEISPPHHSSFGHDRQPAPDSFGGHSSFGHDRQPASDSFGSHSSSFGHDRQPASDSFGSPRTYFDSRSAMPSPSYPSNPYDSRPAFHDGPRGPEQNPPPFGIHVPSNPPPPLQPAYDSSTLRDCKCVCSNEAVRAEQFSKLHNWIKEAQSNPHDVVCMSTTLPNEARLGVQGPLVLPSGHSGYYWTQPGYAIGAPTEPPYPKIDIREIIDNRKNELTTASTTCVHEEPTEVVLPVDPVNPPEPEPPRESEPEPEPAPEPEAEVTEKPIESHLRQDKVEFRSGSEMSESAVAGLVCGIFAVVVLIVVVVVSRKVIVASAKKSKRKSEEETIEAFDDQNCYSKTSSSVGYPPRYL